MIERMVSRKGVPETAIEKGAALLHILAISMKGSSNWNEEWGSVGALYNLSVSVGVSIFRKLEKLFSKSNSA